MSDEARKLVSEIAATRKRPAYGHCTYCGGPSYGWACRAHRDLLRLDPNYSEMRAA